MREILFIILLLCTANGLWGQTPDHPIASGNGSVPSDKLVMRFLELTGSPTTDNNRVELLMSGHEKFIDLFEAIRQARHHIHLEYFNFRNDSIANTLFDLLAVKAAQGVEVRALFDAFGNSSNNQPLKKRHLEEIRSRGIEIVKFDPVNFPWINHVMHRDHRKIVVIDGIIGYTGGMNIADYYIHGLPEIGEWRDMHARFEGDAVRYLQDIFLTIWNKETKQHVNGPAYYPVPEQVPDSITGQVAIVDRMPRHTPEAIRHAYRACIDAAQHNIRILNPYFVPTSSIRKALKRALERGVKVEIMIPAKSDIKFTPDAALHVTHQLMKHGAKVYLFNGGFHHSKIMMVDGKFCTVGTANLNSRSLRYDYETNAFIFNRHTTQQLNDMYDRDCQNSTLLTPEYWKERSAWKKFVGWVGNLLTPFL